ncbi:MAG: hypothetical protein ABIJ61_10525 [bacterium]
MLRRFHKRRSGEGGFTIIEVLIAAIIAGFALTAAFAVFINQNKNHVIQAGITEMQQNGRAAVDELVTNVRRAGYKLPDGLPAISAWNTDPDTIAVAFLHEPACTASLSDPMPLPSAELKCTDSDLTCFEDDMWAYIYEESADTGEFFWITHVQAAAGHIQHNIEPLSRKYGAGSILLVVDYFKYYVDNSDTAHPVLVRKEHSTPDIYADYIEDLQFQYIMADGTISNTIAVDRYVREVLISVTARTERDDLFLQDEKRHENYSTRVRVRNL